MSQHDTLTQALQQIADWNSHTTEFAVDYGSNGVRDFYRGIARAALSATQPAQAAQSTHWTEHEPVRLASSRKGRVYLAGPMTGIADFNFPAFNAEADLLQSRGLSVLNPADHGIVAGATWADYLRHDIAGLASCERIHLLRGWSKSKGAQLEVTIAQALGMRITYQDGAEPAQAAQSGNAVSNALNACLAACDRAIDQDGGVLGGIDFVALRGAILRGQSAQSDPKPVGATWTADQAYSVWCRARAWVRENADESVTQSARDFAAQAFMCALAEQPKQAAQGDPAEHWHRLYLEKCQQYNDHVAQLGGVIEGLEAEAAQGAGEVVAWQASDGGSSYISNEARSRNSAFRELYTIPLYTQPAAGADVKPDTRRIALAIIENLEDRRGCLDGVDDEVKQEMLETFAQIIDAAIAASGRQG